jgi:hypothetical protein
MDLIYTNTARVDQGVLLAYSLDLSFGVDDNENDFELTLGKSEPLLQDGAIIYMDGTEYGGIVGGMRSSSINETRVHLGRTWHGILNDKIICPDPGEDHLIVSGDANEVLAFLIDRLGLGDLFAARPDASGIMLDGYKFPRYVPGYKGIRNMLDSKSAKLKMAWSRSRLELRAEPIVDYASQSVDGDEAILTVERFGGKVNHLICLGGGELADRTVVHLYVDQFGRIGSTQVYTGLAEVASVYDYANANSEEELRTNGVTYLETLRNNDKVSVTAYEDAGFVYDIGDIIGGTDNTTGNTAKAAVAQKVVKIKNGAVSIDYKTL